MKKRLFAFLFLILSAMIVAGVAFAAGDLGFDGNLFNTQNIHFRPASGAITRYLMQYLSPDAQTGARGGIRLCNGSYNGVVATCLQGESGSVPGFLLDIQGRVNISDGILGLGAGVIQFNPPGLPGQLGISTDGGNTWNPIGAGAGGAQGVAGGWVFEEPVVQPQPNIITTAGGTKNRIGINVQGTDPGLATLTVRQPAAYTIANVQVVGDAITPVVVGTSDFFRQVHIGDRITAGVGFPPQLESRLVEKVSLINNIPTITVGASFSQGSANTSISILPSIIRVENADGDAVFGIDGDGNVVGSAWLNDNGVLTTSLGIAVEKDSVFFNKLGVGGVSPTSVLTVKGNASESIGNVTITGGGGGVPSQVQGSSIGSKVGVGDAIRIVEPDGDALPTVISRIVSSDAVEVNPSLATAGGIAYRDSSLFEIQNAHGVSKLTVTRAGNVGIGTTIPGAALDVAGDIIGRGSLRVNGSIVNTSGSALSITGGNVRIDGRVLAGTFGAENARADGYFNLLNVSGGFSLEGNLSVGDGINVTGGNVWVAGRVLAGTFGAENVRADGFFRNVEVGDYLNTADLTVRSHLTVGDGINVTSGNAGFAGRVLAASFGAPNAPYNRSPGYFGTVIVDSLRERSDRSLKTDIANLTKSLDKIQLLNGVSFTWKETGKKGIGVVAQDVEKVFPEAVFTDSETGLKSVSYGNLIAPLIESLKEQQIQIEALKAEVEALKKQR